MRIRTSLELVACLLDLRLKRGLDQGSLAREVGVSRQWIVAMEKGKPRAPIGLVFRTLNALGVSLVVQDTLDTQTRRPKVRAPDVEVRALPREVVKVWQAKLAAECKYTVHC